MDECILDYETRSSADLKILGPIEYAKHKSTSILCVAYKFKNDPIKLWIPERGPMPDKLWWAFNHGLLVAHNAGFEIAITKYCLTRYSTLTENQKYVLRHIRPDQWKCTAAKAAMASLPRNLEHACKALDLPVKKDMEGNRLMKKYMKPRKPSKNNPDLWWNDKAELRAIYRYCMIDVKAEYLLNQALPDLSEEEQSLWELDQVINARGVLIDIPLVKLILDFIKEEQDVITEKVKELSNNLIDKPTQRAAMLDWINTIMDSHDLNPFSNLQAGTIADALKLANALPKDVVRMLEYRQAASMSSTAKYAKMIKAVGEDNRARELLLYCGATPTGRWTGKRIQPQNMPRGVIKPDVLEKALKIIQGKD